MCISPCCRPDEEDPIVDACLLHCTSHITKTAELIKKNNLKVKADPDGEAPRDQGYTRPKVTPPDLPVAALSVNSASCARLLALIHWGTRHACACVLDLCKTCSQKARRSHQNLSSPLCSVWPRVKVSLQDMQLHARQPCLHCLHMQQLLICTSAPILAFKGPSSLLTTNHMNHKCM